MTTTFDMTAPYRLSPEAVESRLGDETVILYLGNSTYFGLDAVGTLIWEGLGEGPRTPSELCAAVRAAFDDAPESVESDVALFPAQLAEQGLILRV